VVGRAAQGGGGGSGEDSLVNEVAGLKRGVKRMLMVVVPVVAALLLVALWHPGDRITPAREAVLRDNLFTMRSLLNQYTLDKHKCPRSLQELVMAGYLKDIPIDPMTGRKDTWVVVMSENGRGPCVDDIRSGSGESARSGSPYREW
jgi:general secretion pathway protein G